ncbi:MAG TPA: ATP-binding protein [Verrucomicrobiae bacterium]|jgi:signal transduction histidine kinase|nr:ATP-binding protein [Verrucomicrobiae bacterium]
MKALKAALGQLKVKARSTARRWVYQRTTFALALMFGVAAAATLWQLSHLSSHLVETGALQATSIYSQSITDLRSFYNSEVVERLRPLGIEATDNYAAKHGTIPIPATFTIEFGKYIVEKSSATQIRIFSEYPFHFRTETGPRDAFEKEALAELQRHPDKPFYRFENFQGHPSLRYATAISMQASCIPCHNSHPESPKTNWRVGDIRGVQEIIQKLDGAAAEQTKAGLKNTFILLATMGILGIGGLGLVLGRIRRTSAELEQRITERAAAEARLEALHEINLASTSTLDLRAVLDMLLEKSDKMLPFIAATTIRLLNRQTGILEPVACRNLDEARWKAETAPGDYGIGRMLPETDKPVMVLNAQTDPRSLSSALLRSQGLVSYLRVPLTAKGRVLGVITFFTKVEHRFTDEETDFLTALAAQAAMAIYNAQLYEETAAAKSELELANTMLKSQTVELARSNAELEQFAYVASHDLQEPLRMVASYTQLLARRYGHKLDADADEFIGYAVAGVNRMQNLIQDLLEYSKIGNRDHFEHVDCASLVQQALGNLRPTIEESRAEVVTEPLPMVTGDGHQLKQLFQNLIGNAIKFRNHAAPKVHVSARLDGDEWIFSIHDNGIGFDPQFADRIFVIFQRLHSKERYAGTGIGLAICKKIVERHNGRIWAESKPGEGATFYFTIPA